MQIVFMTPCAMIVQYKSSFLLESFITYDFYHTRIKNLSWI